MPMLFKKKLWLMFLPNSTYPAHSSLQDFSKMESSANHISELALDLLPRLSDAAKLLVDPSDESFKESMKRWSDVDIQIPSAIFKPALEEDIVEIVPQFPLPR